MDKCQPNNRVQGFKPEVTAIVSVYASLGMLEGCIRDLVGQTLFSWNKLEILIIDAASPEEEYIQVEPFLLHYPDQITYWRSKNRVSLYSAWNAGVSRANGKFLTNANVDDRHSPDCLELLYKALIEDENIVLTYGSQRVIRTKRNPGEPLDWTSCNVSPRYFAPALLLLHPCGCHPMWRKQSCLEIGGFDERFEILGDYDFSLRLAEKGKFRRVENAWSDFFIRPGALSQRDIAPENKLIRNKYETAEFLLKLYAIEGWSVETPQEKCEALNDFFWRCLGYDHIWEGYYIRRKNTRLAIQILKAIEKLGDWEFMQNGMQLVEAINRGDALHLSTSKPEKEQLSRPTHNEPTSTELLYPLPYPLLQHQPAYKSQETQRESVLRFHNQFRQHFLNWVQSKNPQRAIVIVGCGELGVILLSYLGEAKKRVKFFTDRNANKWGNCFKNRPVSSLAEALDQYPDCILLPGSWDLKGIQLNLQTISTSRVFDIYQPIQDLRFTYTNQSQMPDE